MEKVQTIKMTSIHKGEECLNRLLTYQKKTNNLKEDQ